MHLTHSASWNGQTGVVIMLGKHGGPVWAASVKQKIVGRSSTETELIALDYPLPQVMAISYILKELGYDVRPIVVYQDNQSTIKMTQKGYDASSHTKHILVRYFYIKERVDAGDVIIQYLPTEHMIADLLTKPLTGKLFKIMRQLILNLSEQ